MPTDWHDVGANLLMTEATLRNSAYTSYRKIVFSTLT